MSHEIVVSLLWQVKKDNIYVLLTWGSGAPSASYGQNEYYNNKHLPAKPFFFTCFKDLKKEVT